MTRSSRNRIRDTTYPPGVLKSYKNGALVFTSNNPGHASRDTCFDSHGRPVVDSPFSSAQTRGSWPSISGQVIPVNDGSVKVVLDTYATSGLPLVWTTNMSADAPPSGWMLDLVAGTNPSRASIGIPMWMQNIYELPKMIFGLGKLLEGDMSKSLASGNRNAVLNRTASEYLGVKFGWLPLIDDIKKLLEFQKHVLKRDKELHQLYSKKGLRRRLQFGSNMQVFRNVATTSLATDCTVDHETCIVIRKRQWATIHWQPTLPPAYHPDDAALNDLARRLVIGLTPEALAKGAWDVIPWTWLIGWFTNFGKYTLAHSWSVPAQHGSGCFMSECRGSWLSATAKVAGGVPPQIKADGELTGTLKTRSVSGSTTVGFSMPYLDMSKLSVLGALFVQRFFR